MNVDSSLPTKPGSDYLPISTSHNPTFQLPLKVRFSSFVKMFDLTPIKYKLIKEKDWTLDRAELVEAQYKAFLFLLGTKEGRFFIPTLDIDEMWHAHILDTRKYMSDCATLFGEYIHHHPYLGMKDGEDEENAKQLFAQTCDTLLSDLDIDIRMAKFTCCGGGGGCSGSSCGSSCSGSHCGGGHSDGGSGHGHHDSGNSSPISSCGSAACSSSEQKRRKPTPTRKPAYTPPGRPSQSPERRGILRRIFNLSPAAERWFASVSPQAFSPDEYRPDADALSALVVTKKGLMN